MMTKWWGKLDTVQEFKEFKHDKIGSVSIKYKDNCLPQPACREEIKKLNRGYGVKYCSSLSFFGF